MLAFSHSVHLQLIGGCKHPTGRPAPKVLKLKTLLELKGNVSAAVIKSKAFELSKIIEPLLLVSFT